MNIQKKLGHSSITTRFFKIKTLFFLSAHFFCATLFAQGAASDAVWIEGFSPLLGRALQDGPNNKEEWSAFGNNPIIGRQTCPALTRLQLGTGRSEPLLIGPIEVSGTPVTRWTFQLKQDLYWWSGSPVTTGDIEIFFRKNLASIVHQVGGGLWELPPFQINQQAHQGRIEIIFEKPPSFGPFVINGVPLARMKETQGPKATKELAPTDNNLDFECAGLYQPQWFPSELRLVSTPGYKSQKPLPIVRIPLSPDAKIQNEKPSASSKDIRLTVSGVWNYKKNPRCNLESEEPIMTALLWNQKLGITKDAEFRQLADQLIPRQKIAEIIGLKYTLAIETLIPRSFPREKIVNTVAKSRLSEEKKKTTLEKIAQELQLKGYKRPDPKGPRLDRNGQPVEMKILSRSQQFGLIEKVLEDVFSSVGIKVHFVLDSQADHGSLHEFHGVLSSFKVDWPGVNLIGTLHSAANKGSDAHKKGVFQMFQGSVNLDSALEKYAQTLSLHRPDLKLITSVEEEMTKITGVSAILQHKICLQTATNIRGLNDRNLTLDPDWFRILLLTL